MYHGLRRILIVCAAAGVCAMTAGCGDAGPSRTTKPPKVSPPVSTSPNTRAPAPVHELCFPSRGCEPKGWSCTHASASSAVTCRPPAALRTQITDLDARLTVTYRVSDSAKARATVISYACPPAGGDAPDAWVSCGALAEDPEMVVPPQHDICTEQYGGPETAVVTGRVRGDSVRARFARTNGCEISDWTRAQVLWDWAVPGAVPATVPDRIPGGGAAVG